MAVCVCFSVMVSEESAGGIAATLTAGLAFRRGALSGRGSGELPSSGELLLQLELVHVEHLPPAHLSCQGTDLKTWGALVLLVEAAPELVAHAELAKVPVDLGELGDGLQIQQLADAYHEGLWGAAEDIIAT